MSGAVLQGLLLQALPFSPFIRTAPKTLELEYVSEFFWFDSAFLALSDVHHQQQILCIIWQIWRSPAFGCTHCRQRKKASVFGQLIELIESAPDFQYLDMTLGGANPFKQAEGLEEPDNRDYGNIMALYRCLMAKNLRGLNIRGSSTFPTASKDFSKARLPH